MVKKCQTKSTIPAEAYKTAATDNTAFPVLEPDTYHDARKAAPGHDVHWLEQEWQSWWSESGKSALQSPDKAFIAFCKRRGERGAKT